MGIISREIKRILFYRNGLLILIAVLMVYVYRNTVMAPIKLYGLFTTIPAIVICVYLYYNPKLCIYAVTLWIPLRNLLTGQAEWGGERFYVLPSGFKYFESVILGLLTVRWIVNNLYQKKLFKTTPMDLPLLLIAGATLISAVANFTPPEIAVVNLRTFVQFALLYYAIIQLEFDEKYLRNTMKFFLFVSMGQTISSLILFMDPEMETALGDYTVGTMTGGTNLLALYEAMLMCITVGIMKKMPEKVKIYLPLFFWYMISFFTASGRSAIYFFPVALFFIVHQDIKNIYELLKSYVAAFIVIILAISFLVFSGIKDLYYGESLKGLSPGQLYYESFEMKRDYGRFENYKLGFKILADESPSVFLGVGPGMYLSNTGYYFNTPLVKKANIRERTSKRAKERYPPDLSIISTELGIIGALTFMYLYFTGFMILRKGVKVIGDKFWSGVSIGAVGMSVVLVLSSLAERPVEIIYMQHIFWFMCGLIQKIIMIEKEKKESLLK